MFTKVGQQRVLEREGESAGTYVLVITDLDIAPEERREADIHLNGKGEWLEVRVFRYLTTTLAAVLIVAVLSSAALAKVTITYTSTHAARPDFADWEQAVVDMFNARQNEIEVVYVSQGTNVGTEFWERISVQRAAGVGPDIAIVDIEEYIRPQDVVDLTPLIRRDRFDFSGFMAPEANVRLMADSCTMALKAGFTMFSMAYNVTEWERAGLARPYKGWTFDEHLEAARRLTRDTSGDGNPDFYGLEFEETRPFEHWLDQFGAAFATRDGRVTIASPEYIAATESYRDFGLVHGVNGAFLGVRFRDGNAGMVHQNIGQIGRELYERRQHELFDWATAHFPVRPGSDREMGVLGGANNNLVIFRESEHPEAAWEFIKFYFSAEAQELLARGGFFPGTRSGWSTFLRDLELPPGYDHATFLAPAFDPPTRMLPAAQGVDGLPDFGVLWREFRPELQSIFRGEQDVTSTMQRLQPVFQARLSDAIARADAFTGADCRSPL